MGTEQQQEFKSEKRRTGSQIKTVLFTDHSIESWRPKKDMQSWPNVPRVNISRQPKSPTGLRWLLRRRLLRRLN